eukprot:TRINITY_DN2294_c0_g1_i1.p1 TRINITY_DN2294_c0_g1~~TRINITY_DN2294_c0_g1_i1.p1  ORF type:complete len:372 (+),score=70.59 TRINITY_DN2294_c0_g1_i1:158-1273(+)
MTTRLLYSVALLALLYVAYEVEAGKDYYAILGVPRDAPARVIKKAYRELAVKYHPDKTQGDAESEKKYVEIGTAYEVLSDEEKRRVYDQFGEEGLKDGGRGQRFNSPFDIFSQFGFGGGGGGHAHQHEQKKAPSVEIPLEVTLKDLYLGKTFKIGHKKQILCPKCRGTGAKDANDVQTCNECNGSGTKVFTQQLGPGFMTQTQRTCDKCGGKGKIVKSTCPICKGTKVGIEDEVITVYVERGMPDGHGIVFEQENDESPEVTPGDVIFKISTTPHKRFVRVGDDIHMKLNISLLEALVGFTKTVRHLDGHEVKIANAGVTKPGEILTINGEGMPHHNFPSQTGNMYVEVSIKMPSSLTEAQKEGFRSLLVE